MAPESRKALEANGVELCIDCRSPLPAWWQPSRRHELDGGKYDEGGTFDFAQSVVFGDTMVTLSLLRYGGMTCKSSLRCYVLRGASATTTTGTLSSHWSLGHVVRLASWTLEGHSGGIYRVESRPGGVTPEKQQQQVLKVGSRQSRRRVGAAPPVPARDRRGTGRCLSGWPGSDADRSWLPGSPATELSMTGAAGTGAETPQIHQAPAKQTQTAWRCDETYCKY